MATLDNSMVQFETGNSLKMVDSAEKSINIVEFLGSKDPRRINEQAKKAKAQEIEN